MPTTLSSVEDQAWDEFERRQNKKRRAERIQASRGRDNVKQLLRTPRSANRPSPFPTEEDAGWEILRQRLEERNKAA